MENVSSSNGHKEYPHLRFHAEDGTNYPDLESYSMGDLYTERKEAGEEGLPILSVSIHTGVSDGELDESETTKRVKRIDDKSLYRKADTGDLVFNMMRAWQGALGVVKTAGMVSPAYIVAKPNDKIYPPYVDYYVKTDNMVNQIHRLSYGVTDFRLRLYWTSFQAVKCRLPVKQEQKRIADFLKKLDERIEKQRELVENLKKYKRGAVRQLLLPKSCSLKKVIWTTSKMSELGSFVKGAALSKADISEDGTPFILYGELYTTYNEVVTSVKRRTQAQVDELCLSRVGDVVIPTSGETPEEISTASCIMLPGVILAGDLSIFRSNKVDGRIISYILNHVVNSKIARIAQGKSVVHIQANELGKLTLLYPDKNTQKTLIDFLSKLDNKVTKEENILAFLADLKEGLLQQLFI